MADDDQAHDMLKIEDNKFTMALDWNDFPETLATIRLGKQVPPNFQPMDLAQAVGTIAAGAGLVVSTTVERLVRPVADWQPGYGHWARYFLNTTQAGKLDGSGYVLWYGPGGQGMAGRFTICRHSKMVGPNPSPDTGWHPGRCRHCNLDMTVDSSG